jgi:hypothetical protein
MVADPHSFDTDPDLDPIQIRNFDDQKWKKIQMKIK